MGVPVIFPPELAGKDCCVSNEAEMVEAGVGEKDRPLARTEVSVGVREWLEILMTGTILVGRVCQQG